MTQSLPFQDRMRCHLCGRIAYGPAYAGGWRAVEANQRLRIYVCPACQPGPRGTSEAWQQLYKRVLRSLYVESGRKPLKAVVLWRETTDGPRQEAL